MESERAEMVLGTEKSMEDGEKGEDRSEFPKRTEGRTTKKARI
jgi:hypothetical protein